MPLFGRNKKDEAQQAEEPTMFERLTGSESGEQRAGEERADEERADGQVEGGHSHDDEHAAYEADRPAPIEEERDGDRGTWLEDEEQHQRQEEERFEPAALTDTDHDGRADTREEPAEQTEEKPFHAAFVREPGQGDDYESKKIKGAQAREEYARGLAPPGSNPDDEYRWHTGTVRATGVPDAVEFVEVHKAFGRNKILRGLNMGIPEGKISMILGPSGTGKSVCIKHMVGLLYPDDGDILVHGESVPNMKDDELFEMRKKFGVLFQDGALFGSMNLFDNVCFPLRQHTDKSEEEITDIVSRRLREVGLEGAHDKMPNELSGGMRKRAGFARALVLDPDIVLFDEPDSGLDPVRTALLCELIQEIHEENGGAYVVITHDIMSAKRVAEHISVLWKGRIVESGPADELFNSDNMFVRQFLSGASRGPLGME
ncbi:MAG TPA: ABC transporter ATP-binding protein [Solirubrobacteraceae bacterium]